jgi:hypothetical protein
VCGGAYAWHGRSESHARCDLLYNHPASETLTFPCGGITSTSRMSDELLQVTRNTLCQLIAVGVRNRSQWGSARRQISPSLRITFRRHRSARSPPAALLLLRFDRFSQTTASRIIKTPSDSRHSDGDSSNGAGRIDQETTSSSPFSQCF